jgi:hypothetical protein
LKNLSQENDCVIFLLHRDDTKVVDPEGQMARFAPLAAPGYRHHITRRSDRSVDVFADNHHRLTCLRSNVRCSYGSTVIGPD